MTRLKKINGKQWYYQYIDGEIYIFNEYYEKGIDFTEATGQLVPNSSLSYCFTHGGEQYREAVQAIWDLLPEYRTT